MNERTNDRTNESKPLEKVKEKQYKNPNRFANQNSHQIIDKLEIGERVLVYFETIEGRMVIMDLKIL